MGYAVKEILITLLIVAGIVAVILFGIIPGIEARGENVNREKIECMQHAESDTALLACRGVLV